MSDSKRESIIVIAIAMIIIGIVIVFFSLSQPRLSDSDSSVITTQTQYESEFTEQESEASVSFPINLNTCTYEELLAVDNIGSVKASAIIEYRDVIGEYTSVEQIKDIQGIGDETYNQVSPYLCV